MNLQELYTYCRGVIEKHPELRYEVMEHFALAEMECEYEYDAVSIEHECELSFTDIEDLVAEYKSNTAAKR